MDKKESTGTCANKYQIGITARIKNLKKQTDLNGHLCRLVKWHDKIKRWEVALIDKQSKHIQIKQCNLEHYIETIQVIEDSSEKDDSKKSQRKYLKQGSLARIKVLRDRKSLDGKVCRLVKWQENSNQWEAMLECNNTRKFLIKPTDLIEYAETENDHSPEKCIRTSTKMNIKKNHISTDILNSLVAEAQRCSLQGNSDLAITQATRIINSIHHSKKGNKFYKQLSDAHVVLSHIWLRQKNVEKSKADAESALLADPTNDSAFYNRAMCLINEKDFVGALSDLSKVLEFSQRLIVVDVECLIKRSYIHMKLKNKYMCSEDLETAMKADLHKSSVVPEFVAIHEYLALEYVEKGEFCSAIKNLNKALSVPAGKKDILYLHRSMTQYCIGRDFKDDFEEAKLLGIEENPLCKKQVDFLKKEIESPEIKRWTELIKFDESFTGPIGVVLKEAENRKNEKRYAGIDPSSQACDILHTLHSLHSFESTGTSSELLNLINLAPAGSRFAEEIFLQSNKFETIISLLGSAKSSFRSKFFSLKILDVVSNSGNRRLIKILVHNNNLLQNIVSAIAESTSEAVDAWVPVYWCPRFDTGIVAEKYQAAVLAEKSVILLASLSMCCSRKTADCIENMGLLTAVDTMHQAYTCHWDESNMGEGLSIGCIRDYLLQVLTRLKHVQNPKESSMEPSRKAIRDVTRAGLRCSNLNCPINVDVDISFTEKPKPLFRCSRCLITVYCCKDCQTEHWPQHKANCKKR